MEFGPLKSPVWVPAIIEAIHLFSGQSTTTNHKDTQEEEKIKDSKSPRPNLMSPRKSTSNHKRHALLPHLALAASALLILQASLHVNCLSAVPVVDLQAQESSSSQDSVKPVPVVSPAEPAKQAQEPLPVASEASKAAPEQPKQSAPAAPVQQLQSEQPSAASSATKAAIATESLEEQASQQQQQKIEIPDSQPTVSGLQSDQQQQQLVSDELARQNDVQQQQQQQQQQVQVSQQQELEDQKQQQQQQEELVQNYQHNDVSSSGKRGGSRVFGKASQSTASTTTTTGGDRSVKRAFGGYLGQFGRKRGKGAEERSNRFFYPTTSTTAAAPNGSSPTKQGQQSSTASDRGEQGKAAVKNLKQADYPEDYREILIQQDYQMGGYSQPEQQQNQNQQHQHQHQQVHQTLHEQELVQSQFEAAKQQATSFTGETQQQQIEQVASLEPGQETVQATEPSTLPVATDTTPNEQSQQQETTQPPGQQYELQQVQVNGAQKNNSLEITPAIQHQQPQQQLIRLNNIATINSTSDSSSYSSNSSSEHQAEMKLMRIYVIDLDQKLVVGGQQQQGKDYQPTGSIEYQTSQQQPHQAKQPTYTGPSFQTDSNGQRYLLLDKSALESATNLSHLASQVLTSSHSSASNLEHPLAGGATPLLLETDGEKQSHNQSVYANNNHKLPSYPASGPPPPPAPVASPVPQYVAPQQPVHQVQPQLVQPQMQLQQHYYQPQPVAYPANHQPEHMGLPYVAPPPKHYILPPAPAYTSTGYGLNQNSIAYVQHQQQQQQPISGPKQSQDYFNQASNGYAQQPAPSQVIQPIQQQTFDYQINHQLAAAQYNDSHYLMMPAPAEYIVPPMPEQQPLHYPSQTNGTYNNYNSNNNNNMNYQQPEVHHQTLNPRSVSYPKMVQQPEVSYHQQAPISGSSSSFKDQQWKPVDYSTNPTYQQHSSRQQSPPSGNNYTQNGSYNGNQLPTSDHHATGNAELVYMGPSKQPDYHQTIVSASPTATGANYNNDQQPAYRPIQASNNSYSGHLATNGGYSSNATSYGSSNSYQSSNEPAKYTGNGNYNNTSSSSYEPARGPTYNKYQQQPGPNRNISESNNLYVNNPKGRSNVTLHLDYTNGTQSVTDDGSNYGKLNRQKLAPYQANEHQQLSNANSQEAPRIPDRYQNMSSSSSHSSPEAPKSSSDYESNNYNNQDGPQILELDGPSQTYNGNSGYQASAAGPSGSYPRPPMASGHNKRGSRRPNYRTRPSMYQQYQSQDEIPPQHGYLMKQQHHQHSKRPHHYGHQAGPYGGPAMRPSYQMATKSLLSWDTLSSVASGAAKRLPTLFMQVVGGGSALGPAYQQHHMASNGPTKSSHFQGDVANFHKPYPLKYMARQPVRPAQSVNGKSNGHYKSNYGMPQHLRQNQKHQHQHNQDSSYYSEPQEALASSQSDYKNMADSDSSVPQAEVNSNPDSPHTGNERPVTVEEPVNKPASNQSSVRIQAIVQDGGHESPVELASVELNSVPTKHQANKPDSQASTKHTTPSDSDSQPLDIDHEAIISTIDQQLAALGHPKRLPTGGPRRPRRYPAGRPAGRPLLPISDEAAVQAAGQGNADDLPEPGEVIQPGSYQAEDGSSPYESGQPVPERYRGVHIGNYKITPQTQFVQSIIEPSRQMLGQYFKQYIGQISQIAG